MKPRALDFVVWIGGAVLMSSGLANILATANAYMQMSGATSGLASCCRSASLGRFGCSAQAAILWRCVTWE